MEIILTEEALTQRLTGTGKQRSVVKQITFGLLAIVFILLLVAFVWALYRFAQVNPPFGFEAPSMLTPFLLACYLIIQAAMLVTIAMHELGHLVAARLVNYYVALILVGPIALVRTVTGWRWRVATNIQFGGAVITGPLDSHNLRHRQFWMIAGGPIASWIWYGLLLVLTSTIEQANGLHWPTIILRGFTFYAGLTVLLTLLPLKIGHIASDIRQLFALLRNDRQYLQRLRLNMLASQSLAGKSIGALDRSTLDQFIATLKAEHGGEQAALIAFAQALENGEHEDATDYLQRALTATTDNPTPNLLLATGYYHAIVRNDAIQARRWLQYYDTLFGKKYTSYSALMGIELHQSYLHIDALVRQLEGDQNGAHESARQSLRLLAESMDRGEAPQLATKLQTILAQTASPTPIQHVQPQHLPTQTAASTGKLHHVFRVLLNQSPGIMCFALILLGMSGWHFESLLPMTWYGSLADKHNARGEWAEAVHDYSRAIAFAPTEPRLFWRRGDSYFALHDYQTAMQDYDKAVALAELQQDSELWQALYHRGNGYLAMRDWEHGQQDIERLLALTTTDSTQPRWQDALRQIYSRQGYDAYEEGSYPFALLALDRAIALDQDHERSYWYRGATHAALRNYPAAIADYSMAIALLDAAEPSLYQFRGDAYRMMGRYTAALADYTQFLTTTDEAAGQHFYSRGLLHFQLGDYEAALIDLAYAEAMAVDEPLLPIYRALALAGLHDFDGAQRTFATNQNRFQVGELYRLASMGRLVGDLLPQMATDPLLYEESQDEESQAGITSAQRCTKPEILSGDRCNRKSTFIHNQFSGAHLTWILRFATRYAIPAIVSH